jgi:hypothetical protein
MPPNCMLPGKQSAADSAVAAAPGTFADDVEVDVDVCHQGAAGARPVEVLNARLQLRLQGSKRSVYGAWPWRMLIGLDQMVASLLPC